MSTTRWTLCDGVRRVDTTYGAVLLDTSRGRYWQLNECGQIMLTALEEGQDLAGMVAAVTSEFDVAPSQAEEDIHALIDQLTTARLVSEGAQ